MLDSWLYLVFLLVAAWLAAAAASLAVFTRKKKKNLFPVSKYSQRLRIVCIR